MYGKAEKSNIKKEFWTSFGAYMKPILNADGENINWINYKTGIKNIYFRADVNNREVKLSVELKHTSKDMRDKVFAKLLTLKNIFEEHVFGDWAWLNDTYDEDGTAMSKIFIAKRGVSIYDKNDWPQIISFLKQHFISLDLFWCIVKPHFK